jgi:hypothetical protein
MEMSGFKFSETHWDDVPRGTSCRQIRRGTLAHRALWVNQGAPGGLQRRLRRRPLVPQRAPRVRPRRFSRDYARRRPDHHHTRKFQLSSSRRRRGPPVKRPCRGSLACRGLMRYRTGAAAVDRDFVKSQQAGRSTGQTDRADRSDRRWALCDRREPARFTGEGAPGHVHPRSKARSRGVREPSAAPQQNAAAG